MLKLIASEPVSLAEAKRHLRLDDIPEDSFEDSLILDLISAAREYCEKYAGKIFAGKTYEYYLEGFTDEIELSEKPVDTVISIIYTEYDGDGQEQKEIETIVDSSTYILGDDKIKLLEGNSWPVLSSGPDKPVKITYRVGTVPISVRQAMLLLIGHWYRNREATIEMTNKSIYAVQVPFSVKALLDQYRDRWWD